MSYFLIAVSTRQNLHLCIKYALAGFTNSISGLWAFLDVEEGDYVSFLYGAHVHNLYQVEHKAAYRDAAGLPPWEPLTLYPSGRTYHFPFRLKLRPIRTLAESLVRPEFAYVAENLLLRGGYRRTHFQADQTTLQAVSQMGVPASGVPEPLEFVGAETFTPLISLRPGGGAPPYSFSLKELIVQTLLRKYLSFSDNLARFLGDAGIGGVDASRMEVLGEKAFPEGHIDLLIKEAMPIGISRKVVVEVKLGAAVSKDIEQLRGYANQLGAECVGAALVARSFGKRVYGRARAQGVSCFRFALEGLDEEAVPFDRLLETFKVESL